MIKIKWDLVEAVVLLDLLLENGGYTSVEDERLLALSEMYKQKANQAGIVFDEKYRNLSGLRMQLACLQYIVSDGKEGMSNAGKVFHQAYELFQTDPQRFKKIKEDFYTQFASTEGPVQMNTASNSLEAV